MIVTSLMLQEMATDRPALTSVDVLSAPYERAVLETLAEVGVAFTNERQLDPDQQLRDHVGRGERVERALGVVAVVLPENVLLMTLPVTVPLPSLGGRDPVER